MKRWILIVAFAAACGRHPPRPGVEPLPPLPGEGDPPAVTRETTLAAKAAPAVVGTPPAVLPEPPKIPRSLEAIVTETNARLEDAFFAYDRSDLSRDGLEALHRDGGILAPILADYAGLQVVVEGHCDERGSAEYNLALGDRRAAQASGLLRQFGVAADRMAIVSYGKERPQCVDPVETCRQRNRRAHVELRKLGIE